MRGHLQCENGKGLIGLIHAKNVGFEYFRRDSDGEVIEVIPALKDVSMQVQPGDFVAVLGANGSGKSTFAKHLCALLTPGEGTILVAGMDTADEEKHLQIRQTAGMVFQNPDNQLVAGVVEEDVAFGPENIGVESRQIWQRVEESLQSVGMSAYRYASPMHLSGGQKQRVAIAGIVAMRPNQGVKSQGKDNHRIDHTLYGRDCRCRLCICDGGWTSCDGRHTEGSVRARRGTSQMQAGCAGDYENCDSFAGCRASGRQGNFDGG